MKKFLSVILAVAIIICAVPIGVFTVAAENGVLDGYYYYKVENDEATILSVNPAISGAITVPSSLGGYPVTIIGEDAFRGCEGITAVTIPDSVTIIGVDAFYGCSNLSNITTQDNITSIGRWAFHSTAFYYNSDNWENDVLYIGNYLIDSKSDISGDYTIKEGTILIADDAFDFSHNLINVTIPDSVKYIGEGVFSNCSKLASVEIPDGVKTIERYTFSSCTGLKSVTIGSGVENIDFNAFGNCGSLSSIVVKPDNKYFASDETGVLFNKDKTKLIRYPNGKPDTEYEIPDGVVYICENAFWACDDLINVTISDGVKEIGVRAFEKCTDMKSVVISDSVTRIGTAAFSGCYNLEYITIGDGVISIGEKAFDLTQFKN
ncbi:MAG: leucine-rich repeat domain-containing protein, partial [Clostridia bacterium]|nr:leucine-rich repeat domain-containing protein [Clostridia bacterium]